jgi:hypothetical protein
MRFRRQQGRRRPARERWGRGQPWCSRGQEENGAEESGAHRRHREAGSNDANGALSLMGKNWSHGEGLGSCTRGRQGGARGRGGIS